MTEDEIAILTQNVKLWLEENRYNLNDFISKSKKGGAIYLEYDKTFQVSTCWYNEKFSKNKVPIYKFPTASEIRYNYNMDGAINFELDKDIMEEVYGYIIEKIESLNLEIFKS